LYTKDRVETILCQGLINLKIVDVYFVASKRTAVKVTAAISVSVLTAVQRLEAIASACFAFVIAVQLHVLAFCNLVSIKMQQFHQTRKFANLAN
jgi:hypothetical protein